jgi:hypothetical protein
VAFWVLSWVSDYLCQGAQRSGIFFTLASHLMKETGTVFEMLSQKKLTGQIDNVHKNVNKTAAEIMEDKYRYSQEAADNRTA